MVNTIVVVSFSDLSLDPRVNRQIRFLADRCRVIAVGYADPAIPGVEFMQVSRGRKNLVEKANAAIHLLTGRYEEYYWNQARVRMALELLRDVDADVIIANDVDALPLALRVARGAKVIFDAHEYSPRQFENRWTFRLFFQRYLTYLCHTYIPRVDGMMTVGEEIARQYERDTSVRPVVVTNAPDYEDLRPGPVAPQGRIRLVHHGSASPDRKIENMIRAMDYLGEGYELDLLLVGGRPCYRRRLERLAAARPYVRLLEPVPMRELPRFLNQYDMGVYLLEPRSFNMRFALPNKIFEFIQARLAVAVGPSPEMARLVQQYGVGIVAREFSPESIAESIRACSREDIALFKRRAHEAASVLSADANRELVLALVTGLLSGERGATTRSLHA